MSDWTVRVEGCGLLESPVWDGTGLLFSDVTRGGVYRLTMSGEVEVVVPKRRGVGGVLPHADGGVVVSGKNISWCQEGNTRVIFSSPTGGFNDMCTTPDGWIVAGGFDGDPGDQRADRTTAATHLLMNGGESRVLYDGVPYSNGIRCSPDGRRLFHADSATGDVTIASFDGAGTTVGPREVFAHPPSGKPDGLAVDSDGGLWVACFGAGEVVRYDADGALTERVEVPAQQVTSVGFGGADLSTLYVTTADNGLSSIDGGAIFSLACGRHGQPIIPARL